MHNTLLGTASMRGRRVPESYQKPCTRDAGCSCLDSSQRQALIKQAHSQQLLHMDECDDPDCAELAQLRELEKTVRQFTDYDHYERCCDGHHHHHNTLHEDECCTHTDQECGTPEGTCDVEECADCEDEHKDCIDEVEIRDLESCEECAEECHDRGHELEDCPQDHPTSRDNCISAHHVPLPLLGPTNDFDMNGMPDFLGASLTPCTDDCMMPPPSQPYRPPPMFPEISFDPAIDHWRTFQRHRCAPDPCLVDQHTQFDPPQHVMPEYGLSFSSDPMIPSNQYPWQSFPTECGGQFNAPYQTQMQPFVPIPALPTPAPTAASPSPSSSLGVKPEFEASPMTIDTSLATPPDRICQWIMPCGGICNAAFPTTGSLKQHVKNCHATKGVLTCGWAYQTTNGSSSSSSLDQQQAEPSQMCTASFQSEAALTGHISKKHLTFPDEPGPWKCPMDGCNKSFAYKQVRDDHVSSYHRGNKQHCPVCHQWLNAEGSNFKRHMASHQSKEEHWPCKYASLGCKRRFPRVDNLRRHEACCKIGKRAKGVHHHHHTVHNHAGKA